MRTRLSGPPVATKGGQGIIDGMWTDTHCHLDAAEFAADRNAVVARARAAGVAQVVVPAVAASNFDSVRQLAHSHDFAYALGIHPLCVDGAHDDDLQRLRAALTAHRNDARLVAVGEIGLDHFVPGLDLVRQAQFFVAQLKLAREFDLPVILHVRKSVDAVLKQLRLLKLRGGIAHAFNGSAQQAEVFIDLGFKLGFGGTLTFDRALQIRRLAQTVPLASIVMETDAPDIAPRWLYRTVEERAAVAGLGTAQARNEPGELPRIAQCLAQLRGVSLQALAAATSANARAALPGLQALQDLQGVQGVQ